MSRVQLEPIHELSAFDEEVRHVLETVGRPKKEKPKDPAAEKEKRLRRAKLDAIRKGKTRPITRTEKINADLDSLIVRSSSMDCIPTKGSSPSRSELKECMM